MNTSPKAHPPIRCAVELYWLPIGAGGHFVRWNGRVYETIVARLQGRVPMDLYHSALEVSVAEGRYVIEQAPIPDRNGAERGVAAEGPVGSRWAGSLRIFRYEVRRWLGGSIPDLAEAVDSPRCLSREVSTARRILDLVPDIPKLVWGRDELRTGEMWNSNSIISWLLVGSGLNVDSVGPPAGGRAPGWRAGVIVAQATASGAQATANGRRPLISANLSDGSRSSRVTK
jgi:hypothetical protein